MAEMIEALEIAVSARTLQAWLADGGEIALLDVREHGEYGEGHPFRAVSAPYSRLEREVPRLVPRRGTRIVLLDGGAAAGAGELALRARRRLVAGGYTRVQVLQGGAPAWAASGRALFQGVNLPSKTFGELVEHAFDVPRISARDLHARQAAGEPLVLLDGRTPGEHRKMTIPGALPLPNGELALRWAAVAPDPDVPIVVHCAGRTRSIVGAQILRDLGVPNQVYALENGTQGWALAGFELERGSRRELPGREPTGRTVEAARGLASQAGAPALTLTQAQAWLDDPDRTTFVLDVRTEEEFRRGTLPGARHAPGGQLLQATDGEIGVHRGRVLVLDDDDIRAPVVAAWLRRLGFEAATVARGIHAPLRVRAPVPIELPAIARLDPSELASNAPAVVGREGTRVVDLQPSHAYRRAHARGARWSTRSRLAAVVSGDAPVLLVAPDADLAAMAAIDLREAGCTQVAWTTPEAAAAAGWPQDASPACPADADCVDFLFFVHDRHDGNLDAARRYLEWETGLIAQCVPEELQDFRLPAHS